MHNFIARLKRNCRGVATIELALYAPILATMTIGVVDISNAFGRKLSLEQATQRAVEKVMQTTGVQSVSDTIIDEVAHQAEIPDSEKAAKVTVTYRLECDDAAAQTSTDATTFDTYTCPTGTVSEARYIQVEVVDVYEPMFPMHFAGYVEDSDTDAGGPDTDGDDGYVISATAGMRTQ
jgi:Flp pilus assembly protein TadG